MANKIQKEYAQFHPLSSAEWRAWLAAHHQLDAGVWVVAYKRETGKPLVTYDALVEEALCFGWVDSLPRVLDDERHMRLFTPRKPKSPWSRLNKTRIERLLADGRMAPAGLAVVEAAQRDGSWTVYDAVEDLVVPEDLQAALNADEAAARNFAAFPPTSKKNILWWIVSAKVPATRAKRVAETVEKAAQNVKANHFRQ